MRTPLLQVLTLQKAKSKTAAEAKPLATRPEDARLETAAAPAGAVQSAPAPVQAPAAQPSLEPAALKVCICPTDTSASHLLLIFPYFFLAEYGVSFKFGVFSTADI